MNKLNEDLQHLTQSIRGAHTKLYLRDTLAARLMELGHEPVAVTAELDAFYSPTVH